MSIFNSAAGNTNPNKSAEVAQPPGDSVSSLCFSQRRICSWPLHGTIRCAVGRWHKVVPTLPQCRKHLYLMTSQFYAQLGKTMAQLYFLGDVISRQRCAFGRWATDDCSNARCPY
ncbi:unnamed protein product [Rhodiola kirilowii]